MIPTVTSKSRDLQEDLIEREEEIQDRLEEVENMVTDGVGWYRHPTNNAAAAAGGAGGSRGLIQPDSDDEDYESDEEGPDPRGNMNHGLFRGLWG